MGYMYQKNELQSAILDIHSVVCRIHIYVYGEEAKIPFMWHRKRNNERKTNRTQEKITESKWKREKDQQQQQLSAYIWIRNKRWWKKLIKIRAVYMERSKSDINAILARYTHSSNYFHVGRSATRENKKKWKKEKHPNGVSQYAALFKWNVHYRIVFIEYLWKKNNHNAHFCLLTMRKSIFQRLHVYTRTHRHTWKYHIVNALIHWTR